MLCRMLNLQCNSFLGGFQYFTFGMLVHCRVTASIYTPASGCWKSKYLFPADKNVSICTQFIHWTGIYAADTHPLGEERENME